MTISMILFFCIWKRKCYVCKLYLHVYNYYQFLITCMYMYLIYICTSYMLIQYMYPLLTDIYPLSYCLTFTYSLWVKLNIELLTIFFKIFTMDWYPQLVWSHVVYWGQSKALASYCLDIYLTYNEIPRVHFSLNLKNMLNFQISQLFSLCAHKIYATLN